MKKIVKIEIIFGLLSLFLIYVIIASNASITGFVVGASPLITLVSPTENTETQSTDISFMFKYSYEVSMSECSLKLNDQAIKTINSFLSSSNDVKIQKEMAPGSYFWGIECIDSNGYKIISETRRINILEKKEGDLKATRFFGDRTGTVYEFELKEGLELEIPDTIPNDVIRARQDKNYYELSLIRISQDYTKNLEFAELIITPGEKRLTLFTGNSVDVDFDNDGINDLKITLSDVSYRKATFIVKTLMQGNTAPATSTPLERLDNSLQTVVSGSETSKKLPSARILTKDGKTAVKAILVIVTIAIIIAVFLLAKKSRQAITRPEAKQKQEAGKQKTSKARKPKKK
jgi:hypothetical protein